MQEQVNAHWNQRFFKHTGPGNLFVIRIAGKDRKRCDGRDFRNRAIDGDPAFGRLLRVKRRSAFERPR